MAKGARPRIPTFVSPAVITSGIRPLRPGSDADQGAEGRVDGNARRQGCNETTGRSSSYKSWAHSSQSL